LEAVEEMENGSNGSRLRARFAWKNSRFWLDLFAWHGIDEIEAHVRGDWREAREDLKLVLSESAAEGDILSGQAACMISRVPDDCEQPFIDWVAVQREGCLAGFMVEAIHGYDSEGAKKLRLTVNRPVFYAHHDPHPPSGDEGMADMGAIEQRLWLFNFCGNSADLPRRARARVFGAEHYEITAASDGKKFKRNVWKIEPECVDMLSLRWDKPRTRFHLLNTSEREVQARVLRNNKEMFVITLKPGELNQTWFFEGYEPTRV
jgi:hypothetical protein